MGSHTLDIFLIADIKILHRTIYLHILIPWSQSKWGNSKGNKTGKQKNRILWHFRNQKKKCQLLNAMGFETLQFFIQAKTLAWYKNNKSNYVPCTRYAISFSSYEEEQIDNTYTLHSVFFFRILIVITEVTGLRKSKCDQNSWPNVCSINGCRLKSFVFGLPVYLHC